MSQTRMDKNGTLFIVHLRFIAHQDDVNYEGAAAIFNQLDAAKHFPWGYERG